MTAQRREHLVYNNKEYYLTTEPLRAVQPTAGGGMWAIGV